MNQKEKEQKEIRDEIKKPEKMGRIFIYKAGKEFKRR